MRAAIADVVVLFSLHFLSWRCVDVLASGGALDSTSSSYYAGPTHSPTSKLPSFTQSLSDGLAQAVAHEAAGEFPQFSPIVFLSFRFLSDFSFSFPN